MARGSDGSHSFKIKTTCTQLVFSNDARFIGVIGRHVSIGEISTQRIVQKYKELKNPSDVAFSPDHKTVALGSWDEARVADVEELMQELIA